MLNTICAKASDASRAMVTAASKKLRQQVNKPRRKSADLFDRAFISPATSQRMTTREQAGAAFKRMHFDDAVVLYTRAIQEAAFV